uniref:Integrase catalytic domain-containing protein n=1 Tax=Strongyloides venezuelensis TaxID=75913 RepID=A0A0K0FQC4_STRVS
MIDLQYEDKDLGKIINQLKTENVEMNLGIKNKQLTTKFHIENINKKIDNFLKLCKICLQTKDVRRVRPLRNQKFKRMERAYVDIGHSEEYDSEFLVLRNASTNFIIARWIGNLKNCTIKKTLSSIIDTYGVWREIMCDQQSCFMSEEIDV